MAWKNTIRKEVTDKDIEDFLEAEEEDVDWQKSRGFDNSRIRDRDDTFSPSARQKITEMVYEIEHLCQEVIKNVGDGMSFRKQTLAKILGLLEDARDMAINEY